MFRKSLLVLFVVLVVLKFTLPSFHDTSWWLLYIPVYVVAGVTLLQGVGYAGYVWYTNKRASLSELIAFAVKDFMK